VTPVEPRVQSAWSRRLRLNCDEPLSHVAFKFNLRHYIWVILCPINFVGKMKDAVADMAKKFADQDVQDGILIWEKLAARVGQVEPWLTWVDRAWSQRLKSTCRQCDQYRLCLDWELKL